MQLIHGGDITTLQKEYPGMKILDFSANINPLGLPFAVREAMAASVEGCVNYPDPLCRDLKTAIAAYEDVDQTHIICGNGAADLIYRLAFGLCPQKALLLSPTFAEYAIALSAIGCTIIYHTLKEENGFLPTEDILTQIKDVDLVLICNPNNPTGRLIDRQLHLKILQRCNEAGCVLAVDECFLDFVAEGATYSCKKYLADFNNIVILRAFTKIFAMPGLRLGYGLCSDSALLSSMERAGPPWNVSVPSQQCGIAAITRCQGYLEKTACIVKAGQNQLRSGLERLGCKVYPPSANYLFFKSVQGLSQALRSRGILIRDCANYHGLSSGYYRVSVRNYEDNAALIKALEELNLCQI